MGRRAYSRDIYDALLDAYRASPGNHSQAMKRTGWTWDACKRAWELGWKQFDWARPIKTVVYEEEAKARAVALERSEKERELQDAERERIRQAHIEATADRILIRKGVRTSLKNALGASAYAGPALISMSSFLLHEFCDQGPDGRWVPKPYLDLKAGGMTAAKAVGFAKDFNTMLARVVLAAGEAEKVDRLEEGKPTEIVGGSVAVVDLTEEQELEVLDIAADAARKLREEPQRFRVLNGGKTNGHASPHEVVESGEDDA